MLAVPVAAERIFLPLLCFFWSALAFTIVNLNCWQKINSFWRNGPAGFHYICMMSADVGGGVIAKMEGIMIMRTLYTVYTVYNRNHIFFPYRRRSYIKIWRNHLIGSDSLHWGFWLWVEIKSQKRLTTMISIRCAYTIMKFQFTYICWKVLVGTIFLHCPRWTQTVSHSDPKNECFSDNSLKDGFQHDSGAAVSLQGLKPKGKL